MLIWSKDIMTRVYLPKLFMYFSICNCVCVCTYILYRSCSTWKNHALYRCSWMSKSIRNRRRRRRLKRVMVLYRKTATEQPVPRRNVNSCKAVSVYGRSLTRQLCLAEVTMLLELVNEWPRCKPNLRLSNIRRYTNTYMHIYTCMCM